MPVKSFRCPKCKKRKRAKTIRDGKPALATYCRACKRAHDLNRKWGITPEQFDSLLKAQGYKCGICGRVEEKYWKVDHNHTTDDIRGLLCHRCNTGIGLLGDDVRRLLSACQYLIEPPAVSVLTGKINSENRA